MAHAQTVRDHDDGLAGHAAAGGGHGCRLRVHVQLRRRLVQHQHRGLRRRHRHHPNPHRNQQKVEELSMSTCPPDSLVLAGLFGMHHLALTHLLKQRARQRQPLPLPARQRGAALTHACVVAVRQRTNELVRLCVLRRLPHLCPLPPKAHYHQHIRVGAGVGCGRSSPFPQKNHPGPGHACSKRAREPKMLWVMRNDARKPNSSSAYWRFPTAFENTVWRGHRHTRARLSHTRGEFDDRTCWSVALGQAYAMLSRMEPESTAGLWLT